MRRIIVAFSEIDRDMVQRVWSEMDYRLVVCCVTKGGRTEHLGSMQQIGEFLIPSVGRILQSFPPFKCIDFLKCVMEF